MTITSVRQNNFYKIYEIGHLRYGFLDPYYSDFIIRSSCLQFNVIPANVKMPLLICSDAPTSSESSSVLMDTESSALCICSSAESTCEDPLVRFEDWLLSDF